MKEFKSEDFKPHRHKIFSLIKEIGIDLNVYSPILKIYDELNRDFPVFHTREELQQNTNLIIQAKNVVLSNAHLLIANSLKKSIGVSYTNLPTLQQLSSSMGISLPAQFQGISIPSSLIDFNNIGKNAKLAIVQNFPEEVKSLIEQMELRGLGFINLKTTDSKDISNKESQQIPSKTLELCETIEVRENRFFANFKIPFLDLNLGNLKELQSGITKPIVSWVMSKPKKEKQPSRATDTYTIEKGGGKVGAGQIQDILKASIDFYRFSYQKVRFKFLVSKKQCSDLRLHVIVDGKELGVTEWLGYEGREEKLPIETDILTIENLEDGNHTLTLQPEGRVGGCNNGQVIQWEGKLSLYSG